MTTAAVLDKCPKGHKLAEVNGEAVCYRCLNDEIRDSFKPKKVVRERPVREPKAEPLPTTLVEFMRNVGDPDKAPCRKGEMEAARELCQLAYQVVGDEDPGSCLSRFLSSVCERSGRDRSEFETMTLPDALRSTSRYASVKSKVSVDEWS